MSVERESKVSVADSTTTINPTSELREVQPQKSYFLSARSTLISIFTFIIVSNLANLAFPVILVFDNGYTLYTINAALAAVGIYFVVKEKVNELPVFAGVLTLNILINLSLSIAKIVYVDTTFCSNNFSGVDLENCLSQAKGYVINGSISCSIAILLLGIALYNIFQFHKFLKSKTVVTQV
jgi:ethanolamine transporter EutH